MKICYVIEFKNTNLGVFYYMKSSEPRGITNYKYSIIVGNFNDSMKFDTRELAQKELDGLVDKDKFHIIEHAY